MSSANDGNQSVSDWDGYSMSTTFTSQKENVPQVNNSDIANEVFFEDQILWGNDPNKSYFAYMMEGERVWQETHPNSSILQDERTLDDATNLSQTIMAPSDTSEFNTIHTRVCDAGGDNKNGLILGDGHTEYVPPEAPRNGTVLVMNTNPIAQSYPTKAKDIPSVIYVDEEERPQNFFKKGIFGLGSNETASIGQSFDIGRSNRRLLIAFILLLILTISAATTFVTLSLTKRTSSTAHATGRVGDESLEFQPPITNRNASSTVPTMLPSSHGNWSSPSLPVAHLPTKSPSITSAVPSRLIKPSSAPSSKNTDKPKSKTSDRPSHATVDAVSTLTPQPSLLPSSQLITYHPSAGPTLLFTDATTAIPTNIPTQMPSTIPVDKSILIPTSSPTPFPVLIESPAPTSLPTNVATMTPVVVVTPSPTNLPSNTPTPLPVEIATPSPSFRPTKRPSNTPTLLPVEIATLPPSPRPTKRPSSPPTIDPTRQPSEAPTPSPTIERTDTPTTTVETKFPSVTPVQLFFTLIPTTIPSIQEIPVQASVNVDKSLYTLGESIVVRFQNNPPRTTDWIAMQNLDDALVEKWTAVLWVWTCGTQTCGGGQEAPSEGTIVFESGNPDKDGFQALQPGAYIMHLLRGASTDTHESFAKSAEFIVVAAAPISTPTVDAVPTPDAAPSVPPVSPPDAAPAVPPVSPPVAAPVFPPIAAPSG